MLVLARPGPGCGQCGLLELANSPRDLADTAALTWTERNLVDGQCEVSNVGQTGQQSCCVGPEGQCGLDLAFLFFALLSDYSLYTSCCFFCSLSFEGCVFRVNYMHR